MKRDLPRHVHRKHGSFWHVKETAGKQKWTKLCRLKDGLPAMYLALGKLTTDTTLDAMMPKLAADWMDQVASAHSKKTQADDTFRSREISEAFADFRADEVKPPDVIEFLKRFKKMPRTYNAYRAAMRELMRFAEEKGLRAAGTNPCASIKTMSIKARARYITDSELRRVKVAAMYGKDGLRTRSGATLCALVDMAYLTGQRISDLLSLEWSQIGPKGILFEPSKTEDSTGVRVLIGWSPKLKNVVERLRNPAMPEPTKTGKKPTAKPVSLRFVFTTQEGQPYKYSGASTAWKRAVKRSGVTGIHFHDLRAKAITDKDRREGMHEARTMGGHSTEQQTADYVRHRTARTTGATR